MQALKLAYARRLLAQARRRRNPRQPALFEAAPQHVWQKRFYDFNVWSERNLVTSPELWRWSSFRSYSPGENGLVRVNDWEVLKMKIGPLAA